MRGSLVIIAALLAVSCDRRKPVADDAGAAPDASGSDLAVYSSPDDARRPDAALPPQGDGRERPIAPRTCQATLSCSTRSDCEERGLLDCEGGQCIMCRVDADCPETWSCDPATSWCRLCTSDADCTIGGTKVATGKCDPTVGQCVHCDDDDDCASAAGPLQTKHCTSVATLLGPANMCVGCVTNDDCSASQYKGCDTTAGTCSRCTTDAECCPFYQASCGLTCDTNSGQCLCSSDQQCADAYKNPVFKCTPGSAW